MGFVIGKYGGSSTSTPSSLDEIVILSEVNPDRRIAIVSAPGTSNSGSEVQDYKLTDLLIAKANRHAQEHYRTIAVPETNGKKSTKELDLATIDRFIEMKLREAYYTHDSTATLVADTITEINHMAAMFKNTAGNEISVHQHSVNVQYLGEKFAAQNLAGAYRAKGKEKVVVLDPKEFICLNGENPLEGKVLLDATVEKFRRWKASADFDPEAQYILPGYYGKSASGEISLLGRDGTNMSLVLAGIGLDPDFCENFSDVPGIYEANPKLVPHARVIKEVTPKELRELVSRVDFKVFQARSLALLERVPYFPEIQVKDFAHAHERGTAIVSCRDVSDQNIVGIGVRDGVTYIRITDPAMADQEGYFEKASGIIRSFGANILHVRDSATEITFYVSKNSYKSRGVKPNNIYTALMKEFKFENPTSVKIGNHGSVLGVIGGKMDARVMDDMNAILRSSGVRQQPFVTGSDVALYTIVHKDDITKSIGSLYDALIITRTS
ncbi:aspartate kinase [Candidatus Woesearchaeota archaeon]|nr:aspartate kinase [Candidatus Woesearchaeota archaeon]